MLLVCGIERVALGDLLLGDLLLLLLSSEPLPRRAE